MNLQEMIKIFSKIKKLNTEYLTPEGKRTQSLSGTVIAELTHDDEIIFYEKLHWEKESSLLINSKNVYRWGFSENNNIQLEHLRFGKCYPVFLVEFSVNYGNTWKSNRPHFCKNDLYSADLTIASKNIILRWTVKGPAKNYLLNTIYS